MNDAGFISLRDAVIKTAISDWKNLCRKKHKKDSDFISLIRFFERDCNGLLAGSDMSGEVILEELYKIPGAPERKEKA